MLQRRKKEEDAGYAAGLLTMEHKADGVIEWVKHKCAPLLEQYYTVNHWREQAGIVARQHSNLGSDIGAIVFGHTHCPDTATVEWQPGVTYTYYNTGSWVETEPCMPYLVIGDDGIMQGRCFRVRDRQHLGVGECGPGNCTYQGKH